MIKNYCLSRKEFRKVFQALLLQQKAPTIAEALTWSIPTMLVVFERVFKIDKLPIHASSPCWVATSISEPLAGLHNVVLVYKPLVSLICLPCSFKLPFGRLWNVVEYMAVQVVVCIYIKLINERLAQQESIAIAIMSSLEYQMLMVAVIMLATLFLPQSSSPSSHSIAPFHFQKRYFRFFLLPHYLL